MLLRERRHTGKRQNGGGEVGAAAFVHEACTAPHPGLTLKPLCTFFYWQTFLTFTKKRICTFRKCQFCVDICVHHFTEHRKPNVLPKCKFTVYLVEFPITFTTSPKHCQIQRPAFNLFHTNQGEQHPVKFEKMRNITRHILSRYTP